MKNIYLYIVCLVTTALTSVWGQVEIYNGKNSTTNIAGTTVEISLWGEVEGTFYFKNMTSSSMTYQVTRVQLSPINFSIREQLCVGDAAGGGNCYVLNTTKTSYTFPTDITLDANEKGSIEYIFDQYDAPAFVNNRYIVSDNSGNKIDSVDIKASASVGTSSLTNTNNVSVTSYPNPASDIINVRVVGSDDNIVKIIDVLGNVVYSERINGNKKINVAELNNGVYIMKISTANGKDLQNKKIIIKH